MRRCLVLRQEDFMAVSYSDMIMALKNKLTNQTTCNKNCYSINFTKNKSMKRIFSLLLFVSTASLVAAQNRMAKVTGEEISYKSADGTILKGYVAYDEAKKGKRPAIVVIHEWWGNNDYSRQRADMLAGLGYIAIAADMYGGGKEGPTPKEAW